MPVAVALRAKPAAGRRVSQAIAALEGAEACQAFFARHIRLIDPRLAQRLLDQSRVQLRVDFHRSLTCAQAAAAIAEQLGDERLHALSVRAMANALSVGGHNQASVERHAQAIAAFERLVDGPELARTLSACVQPLLLLGRYDQALAFAERARNLFVEQGDAVRLARLDIMIGNLLHRQDRFTEAMVCYERAHQALVPLGDADGILSAIHNKAVTLTTLNNFRDALAAYEEARRLSVERGLDQAVAQADYNIAWLYYLRGEYSRAIEILHTAAAASKRTGDGYHAALSLLDLSEIYLELNLSVDAREMAEQAHTRFNELGMGYEAAKALANAATSYGQEGKAFRAIELFDEARARMVRENNLVWPSLIDLYQAILLVDEGRLFEARRLALAALEQFHGSALRAKTALCHLLLARIALRLEDAPAARHSCDLALAQLSDLESPILTYHARLLLGHALSRSGDRAGAYAAYQVAREALETLRSRLNGEELKIAFVKNKGEVYERLVQLCLDGQEGSGGFEEAFAHVEQAKSRTLFDLMFQPVHALAREEGSESQLAHSIRELREELNWYYHLVELEQLRPGDQSSDRLNAFQREIGSREKEMARTLRELSLTDTPQSDLHAPAVYSLDAIRAALPADTTLIEFFQVDDRIVLCLVDQDRVEMAPVSLMSKVAGQVRMLQFQFSKFRLGADYIRTFQDALLKTTRAHLHELFKELLAPVWSQLQGRRLVIVPHSVLHYVPFHALFDGERYVIDSCAVSYAPSASVYARCQQQPGGGGQGALVLGVPDTQAPFIDAEARAVAESLPDARLFIGADATEQVLRSAGRESRIVHIASHGYFRPENPMFSGIRLGDTYLNVYDLYRLRLRADLVALSGCATGANVAAAGDELLGITRGLFCAGAQTLLLSLWNVHDESTSAFMTLLYGRIARGAAPVTALRDTMLDLRAKYPHPYYWAPFVLTGKSVHA
ncbi:MAG TPA: CHAT domain-containing tetratricopeptide repeat protein [Vicinamibacterales bacterium]|nr:CHAT domain-containing tetratricopeptide repeat protein [Vicinamibacterales bacterium]